MNHGPKIDVKSTKRWGSSRPSYTISELSIWLIELQSILENNIAFCSWVSDVMRQQKKTQTSSFGNWSLYSSILDSISWMAFSAWLTVSTISFFFLSSSANFSACCTMFSMSSLLNPPLDWITTKQKVIVLLSVRPNPINIKLWEEQLSIVKLSLCKATL